MKARRCSSALKAAAVWCISVLAAFTSPNAAFAKDGVSLDITYFGEVWSAASGGLSSDLVYMDSLDVALDVDLGKTIGWEGGRAFVYGLYNNGAALTDNTGDVQTISNIETGVQAVRLYEAYIEQTFANASLKVGIQEMNFDFDVLESGNLFVHAAQGLGSDLALSSELGPSTYPFTSLGARLQVTLRSNAVLRLAIYDGVPGDPERLKRTAIKLGGGDGALVLGELDVTLAETKVLLGHWRYTKAFNRFDGGVSGGNAGTYIRAERALIADPANPGGGLTGFVRLGIARAQTNAYNRFIGAGLVYTGALLSRKADQLGLAVAAAIASTPFKDRTGASGAETAIELTYRAQITDFFAIQPDVQYILNPAADPARTNVLAVGLRGEIGMSF